MIENENSVSIQTKKYNDLLKDIDDKLKQANLDFENTQDIIKEHCAELRRQVQLDKEIKIQLIEKRFDLLMQQINDYEKESFEHSKTNENIAKRSNEIKQLESQLKSIISREENLTDQIVKLIRLSAKITQMIKENKECSFQNEKMTNYMPVSSSFDNNILGFIRSPIFFLDQMNAIKTDLHLGFMKFLNDKNILPKQIQVKRLKYLPNNELIVALNVDIIYDIVILRFDSNGLLLNYHIFEKNDSNQIEYYFFTKLFTNENRICVEYKIIMGLTQRNGFKVFDFNLSCLHSMIRSSYDSFVGMNGNQLFLQNGNKSLVIFDWSLQKVDKIGLDFFFRGKYHEIEKLLIYESNGKEFYCFTLMVGNQIKIFDKKNADLIKEINTYEERWSNVEINSKNQIVLFFNDKVIYYDSNGEYLKEQVLWPNCDCCANVELFFLDNNDQLCYFEELNYFILRLLDEQPM